MCAFCGFTVCPDRCPYSPAALYEYQCPVCYEPLDGGETVYRTKQGHVVGCEHCLTDDLIQDLPNSESYKSPYYRGD